jgi:hypothetical protein
MAASSFYLIWLRPLYQLAVTDPVTTARFFYVTWLKWITAKFLIDLDGMHSSSNFMNMAKSLITMAGNKKEVFFKFLKEQC